jgi:uncharacterized cupredoxin-like copper-binding protein
LVTTAAYLPTTEPIRSLGEASRNCIAGSGKGIKPGAAGWVTLQISPGRYELVCNEKYYYSHGMFTELQVD